MTRLFLMTLLVLSSGPAHAEWIKILTLDQGETAIYADPSTIIRDDDSTLSGATMAYMEVLYDFKTIQTAGDKSFLSMKMDVNYDCATERSHFVGLTEYAGNMGKGNVVVSGSVAEEDKWQPVNPRSIEHKLWQVACGKK